MQTIYNILSDQELLGVKDILAEKTLGEFTTEKHHIKVRQAGKLDGECRLLQVLDEFQGKTIPKLYAYLKDAGFDCLVTELIEGKSVSESPRSELPSLFLQYANILNVIHIKTGVVHCDIKPDHLFVTAKGLVVLDFDLAYNPRKEIKPVGWYYYLQYPNQYHLGEYRGSPRYSSINSHLGLAPSPSWDFESFGSSYSDPQARFIKKLSFALTERSHLYSLVVESQRKDSSYFLEQFNKLVSEFVNPVSISYKPQLIFQEHVTQVEPRPEPTARVSASLHMAEQASKSKTSRAIELQVRHVIGNILGTNLEDYNLTTTSKYYSAFRAGKEGQTDIYGTDIPTTNNQGTILGEVFCFPTKENDEDAQFSKLFLKTCAQLEADLIRFQCIRKETPHPVEILDNNVWACVATGAYLSLFNRKKEQSFHGVTKLMKEEKGFPRIFLLALLGRFNLFVVHDTIIQTAIEERSWHSSIHSSISDKQERMYTLDVWLLLKSGLTRSFCPIPNLDLTLKDVIDQLLDSNKNTYPDSISIFVANADSNTPDPATATPIDTFWLKQNAANFTAGQVLIVTLSNYKPNVTLIWQKGPNGYEMQTKPLDF